MNKLLRKDERAHLKLHLHRDLIGRVLGSIDMSDTAIDCLLEDVAEHYAEGQRHYHTVDHLNRMIVHLEQFRVSREIAVLLLAVLFHDYVYDPTRQDNEEQSADRLGLYHATHGLGTLSSVELERGKSLIKSTKLFAYEDIIANDPLARKLREMDLYGLLHFKRTDVAAASWDLMMIMKEYQWIPWRELEHRRTEFLLDLARKIPKTHDACMFQVNQLQAWRPKIALFAGSFAPPHVGHLSVLRQAERIFDKVILGVGVNREKHPDKSEAQIGEFVAGEVERLRSVFRFHEVIGYTKFLTDAIAGYWYRPTLVRGLRTDTDFKNEEQLLRALQDLVPEIKVVYIPCEKNVEHVSSTVLRGFNRIKQSSGDALYGLTAKGVYGLVE